MWQILTVLYTVDLILSVAAARSHLCCVYLLAAPTH